MIKRPHLLLLALLATLLPTAVHAQSMYRAPSLDEASAAFGGAVAIGNRDIFVGEAQSFTKPGLVHVYQRGTDGSWTTAQTLQASDGAVNDQFGRALATDGTLLFVAAPQANEGRGRVYVFEQDPTSKTWTETAQLTAQGGKTGDQLGTTLALEGDYALVGASDRDERTGAVYVFRRDSQQGQWVQHDVLVGSDVGKGDRFGSAIAMAEGRALISAPSRASGTVYVFRFDATASTWIEGTQLTGSDVDVTNSFGSAVHLQGDEAFIGAPRSNDFAGSVHVFRYNVATGGWVTEGTLTPSGQGGRDFFGSAIQSTHKEVWVGAPGTGGFAGLLYRFQRDEAGTWVETTTWAEEGLKSRDFFGGTFAVKGRFAIVSATGTDYGEGMAVILERNAVRDEWDKKARVFNDTEALTAITGSQVDCTDGEASSFTCSNVDLISFFPLKDLGATRGVRLNDVWGWTDPLTGKEYGLVGHLEATTFIDLSDPFNPIYLGQLLRTEGTPGSTWRDIKVYKNHAYIVADGAGQHGMQVFDLTQLRNVQNPPVTFEATAHYDKIASAHNIVINEETGFAFSVGSGSGGETCGGGLHMIDIREPAEPTFAGCFADPATGRASTGYSHDAQCVIYRGPDVDYQGKEICIGANETAISIADVTDKDNPITISSGSYPDASYVHQGWLTEDQRYFFQNDELDEVSGKVDRTRTLIWDVSDLDDPVMIKEYVGDSSSTDHNLYIRDNLMYQTNNASGVRIIDVSNPENPVEVGFFDTTPTGLNEAGFDGTWSSYPYFESGMILVTSRREGLFVLKKREVDI